MGGGDPTKLYARTSFPPVAARSLYELQNACADPAAALAAGDYQPLAAVELGALGLRATGGH